MKFSINCRITNGDQIIAEAGVMTAVESVPAQEHARPLVYRTPLQTSEAVNDFSESNGIFYAAPCSTLA